MIKELLGLINSHPEHAVTILALAFVGFILYLVSKFAIKQIVHHFNAFSEKQAKWEVLIAGHMSDTRKAMATHSEDLGKATKAVNGDMLEIKESVFDLKKELLDRGQELRDLVSKVQHEVKLQAVGVNALAERFEAKYGGIIELRGDLEQAFGRIVQIEDTQQASQRQTRQELLRHTDLFRKAAKSLNIHATEIQKLKKGGGNGGSPPPTLG